MLQDSSKYQESDTGTLSSTTEETEPTQGMDELLQSVEPYKPLRRGDVVEGEVMQIDAGGILVSIGHKAEGVVPPREMRSLNPEEVELLKEGDELVTYVVKTETADAPAILSVDRAAGEKGWRTLAKALESGEIMEGEILGFNRGGAIVDVEGVQGFIPMSQLVTVSRERFREIQEPRDQEPRDQEAPGEEPKPPPERTEPEPSPDIGKVLSLKVLEVNRSRNRAILSERQVIQQQRDIEKARLIETLTEGEVRHGKVTGISSFGAFVDLGGADGLIHISEFAWSPVSSPGDMVKIGQELDVYILRVDAENKKIALSLRRLQPEPWETIGDRFEVGDLVDAVITKLTNFGAFARIEGSVEGLIHISELASRNVNHPRQVVKEGEEVKVRILRIEPERRRLGLSLKQVDEEEDSYGFMADDAGNPPAGR